MKPIIFTFLILMAARASAQTMTMTDQTTDVRFESRHLLGKLEGTIRGVNGTVALDSTNTTGSFFKMSFQTSTFLHNDQYVGPDMFKTECFDVKAFPTIDLASNSITKLGGANQYRFNGTLTVKGISKKLSFPFTATPNVGGYDFVFNFPINKSDFNLDCAFKKKLTFKVKGYSKKLASLDYLSVISIQTGA